MLIQYSQAIRAEKSYQIVHLMSRRDLVVFNRCALQGNYCCSKHFCLIRFVEDGKKILRETIGDIIDKLSLGPNELVQNRSLELISILKS